MGLSDMATLRNMKIHSHKELNVWQAAMELAHSLFLLTKNFPKDEIYSLTDQLRRSSRSVAANISEAWRKRRYQAAFIAKLNDAEGEAAESQTHIEIARRCQYIADDKAADFDQQYDRLLSQLVTMARNPDKWTL